MLTFKCRCSDAEVPTGQSAALSQGRPRAVQSLWGNAEPRAPLAQAPLCSDLWAPSLGWDTGHGWGQTPPAWAPLLGLDTWLQTYCLSAPHPLQQHCPDKQWSQHSFLASPWEEETKKTKTKDRPTDQHTQTLVPEHLLSQLVYLSTMDKKLAI